MDAATGQITDYPEQEQGDKISLQFHCSTGGSLLLFIADKSNGLKRYTVTANKSAVKGTAVRPFAPRKIR